jgi:hypothetical protein
MKINIVYKYFFKTLFELFLVILYIINLSSQ